MLEQVGHAPFAGAFMTRAHQVGDVDRQFGLGRIREEEQMKAVGIGILRDALDGGDLLNALRKGLAERRESQKQRGTGKGEVTISAHKQTFTRNY